jgi:hypothetical protein
MGSGLLASSPYIEYTHKWTVFVWDRMWGVDELEPLSADAIGQSVQPTRVWLGVTAFDTNLTAFDVLGIGVIGALLLVAAVAWVITKVGRGKTT